MSDGAPSGAIFGDCQLHLYILKYFKNLYNFKIICHYLNKKSEKSATNTIASLFNIIEAEFKAS